MQDLPLTDLLAERYLAYALSTITSRSLPDARDGLKPVHRRLLYAMSQLSLRPTTPPKKSAKIVGEVMGNYHPHGDSSIYDALVRLAQDFAARYPLIDGQGNFGNIDGDNPAAMRYTESRLTVAAELLLQGIDENAVDFRSTYDDTGREPVVLPAAFPNLLANGASGIAVGMATSIPPHNVAEICSALLYLIKSPKAAISDILNFMPGPDFPTGGILVEDREMIEQVYTTGRGSLRLRAKWEIEKISGGGYQIVVTEIPWLVQKGKLEEKIDQLLQEKKLPLLDDIRDESAEDIRLVLIPKSRNIDADILMAQLFRMTELEARISVNLNALDKGRVPRVMNLKELLQAFLDHRHEVLVRRSEWRLNKIKDRLEILGGLLIAYLNLDEVIRIIRTEDEPKPVLIKKFKLSETQAEAILNMRLRNLRKLEEMEIRGEDKALKEEQAALLDLLSSDKKRWAAIADQIKAMQKHFGADTPLGRRRTEITAAPAEINLEDAIPVEREPITVVCSDKGWVRAFSKHDTAPDSVKYKEGDKEKFFFPAWSSDKILVFATSGKFYAIGADVLPSARGHGEALKLLVDVGAGHDITNLFAYDPAGKLLVASDSGHGFIVPQSEILAQTKSGKQILNPPAGAEAKICTAVPANADHVAVLGANKKLLVFPMDQLPEMAKGKGVLLQKSKDGGIIGARAFNLKEGLTYGDSKPKTLSAAELKEFMGERAQAGRIAPRGFRL
ncbi:MAG TPA: DNA topoisomerase IV subunit A [Rhodospirillaceae bacterium]|nr:DNA topoisomerase IV subunit A [Rhodospirillaceae bacterium]